MKWIIIAFLLLASCSQIENTKLKQCDDSSVPCLRYQETLDEYNYCEANSDCVFAPATNCECGSPDSSGKAVNENSLSAYTENNEKMCESIDFDIKDCPQYAPPNKYSIYEPQCINNMCRTVRLGYR